VALDKHKTSPAHVNQVIRKIAQTLGMPGPSLFEERAVHQESCAALKASHPLYDGLRMTHLDFPLLATMAGSCKFSNSRVFFALCLTQISTLVTGKFMRIWEFIFYDHTRTLTESSDQKLT
jgi:hypothetical protein